MKKKPIALLIVTLVFIGISLAFASLHLFQGEILFHTDLARDILIVEEIVETRRPDLIGPRAGGIPGLFFGPIWYYMMIPFFLIGNGNPIAIGVFWFLMAILALFSVWYVAVRIFGKTVGLLSAIAYASILLPVTVGFTQSFASLIISPILFLLLIRFQANSNEKYIILISITLGITFHFQPAFALLVSFITFVYVFIILLRRKQFKKIFFFFFIILPLSNFIIFDVRHEFLQIRAFLDFITNPPLSRTTLNFSTIFLNRIEGFFQRLNIFQYNNLSFYITTFFIHLFILIKLFKNKQIIGRQFYILFYVFYTAFWCLSFLFKGLVWDFYHWGFLPLIVIVFSSMINFANKKLFIMLYLLLIIPILFASIKNLSYWKNDFSGFNSSSWKLNKAIAEYMFEVAKDRDFGYFVYSPDEFGYSVKYALNYKNKFYPHIPEICSKKPLTFLIYYPTPAEGVVTDPRYWKEVRVNIDKNPRTKKIFGEGIVIEEYNLTEDEIIKEADSSLICDLIFR